MDYRKNIRHPERNIFAEQQFQAEDAKLKKFFFPKGDAVKPHEYFERHDFIL